MLPVQCIILTDTDENMAYDAAMDLKRLRTFVAVADLGTVSAAAVALRVGQPALSRQLQDLRDELDIPLFEPVGRRLRLTTEGSDLLAECRALLRQADALLAHARGLSRGDSGELRFGVTPQTMTTVVAGFLGRFAAAWPKVRVRPVEAGGVEARAMLRAGELHAALSQIDGDLTDFVVHHLADLVILAVHNPRRVPALPPEPEVGALAGVPLLLLTPPFGTRKVFDAACRVAGFAPDLRVESSATEALLALAAEGHGIAVVPSTARIADRRLRAVPLHLHGRPMRLGFGVLWLCDRRLPHYATAFSTMLAEHIRAVLPAVPAARRITGPRRRSLSPGAAAGH